MFLQVRENFRSTFGVHWKTPNHSKKLVIMAQQYYCVDYVVTTMIGSYTISVKNSLIVVTMSDFRTIRKNFIVVCAYINVIKHNLTGKTGFEKALRNQLSPWSVLLQLQSFTMARYPLTGSRVSLSASTRVRGMHLKKRYYHGLKLTEQVLKVLERIVDSLIRQLVSIDESQFGFVPGRGTTDTIFVVRQLQEKYLVANKRLYMASVDLEKALDRVPRKVIWWVLRKLGVEEWIVWLVQGMFFIIVPLWGPLGGPLCRWHCYHRWIAQGMCQEA